MDPSAQQAPVVLLAGGTGGAKLARGLRDIVGDDLIVIANTGDDVEIHDAHVSPDPDLICFWLADRIDERGWGLAGDTSEYMQKLDGRPGAWFHLGDEDREIGVRRRGLIAAGGTLTEAISEMTQRLGVRARVLPMSDDPVRTKVRSGDRWFGFQEFMVRERAMPPIDDVRYEGAETATPTRQVLDAIANARTIIIGPSNPVASIGPILAVCGDALRRAGAPVIAVSPVVGGKILKGPTEAFMAWAGHNTDAAGVAAYYGDVIDGLVTDEPHLPELPTEQADTDMAADGKHRLAQTTLAFADRVRSTTAILPIKRFENAKQRLGRDDLPPRLRRALAEAMARDVLDAALSARHIDRVVVVTGEPSIAGLESELGFDLVDDPDEGHSEAAKRGIERALAGGAHRAILLAGDCPLLSGDSILDTFDRRPGVTILSDRHGDGTNGLVLTPPDAITPAFGPGSRLRHEALALKAGLTCTTRSAVPFTHDVDTKADLGALVDRLRESAGDDAPRTQAVLRAEGLI